MSSSKGNRRPLTKSERWIAATVVLLAISILSLQGWKLVVNHAQAWRTTVVREAKAETRATLELAQLQIQKLSEAVQQAERNAKLRTKREYEAAAKRFGNSNFKLTRSERQAAAAAKKATVAQQRATEAKRSLLALIQQIKDSGSINQDALANNEWVNSAEQIHQLDSRSKVNVQHRQPQHSHTRPRSKMNPLTELLFSSAVHAIFSR